MTAEAHSLAAFRDFLQAWAAHVHADPFFESSESVRPRTLHGDSNLYRPVQKGWPEPLRCNIEGVEIDSHSHPLSTCHGNWTES